MNRKALGLNIGSNWLVLVLGVVVSYILLPFSIRMLGQEQYGLWLLITSLTGYLGLLVLGVPMASVRYIARHLASKDYDAMNADVGTCAGLYLAMGLASLIIGAGLFLAFQRFYAIPSSLLGPAQIAFWLVLLYVAAGFLGQLPVGILNAHGDFVTSNMVLSTVWILRLAFTVLSIYYYRTLVSLAVVQLLLLVLQGSVMWAIIIKNHPHIRWRLWRFRWSTVRNILSFSIFVLVLNLSSRLSFETDSLVIGHYLNVKEIPYYSVGNNVSLYLIEFVIGIAAVVMPAAAKLSVTNETELLKEIYLKWSKVAFSIALLAGVYLIVFGPQLIGWWINSAFEGPSGQVLQILMISNLIFLPARGVCLPILMGLGKPGKATIAFLISGVMNLLLSIILARPFGLAGVAWGTAIPSMLFGASIWILTCREVRVSLRQYMSYVIVRPILGAIPFALFLLSWQALFRMHGLISLGASGMAGAIVFAAAWIFFVYRNDKLVNLQSWIPVLRS